MGWPGEEFFEPIRQGLSDLTKGVNLRDERRLNRAKQDLSEREQRQKETKDLREQLLAANVAQTAGNSKLAADPALASALGLAGKDISPALKPKIDNDTLSYFKMNLMKQGMGLLEQLDRAKKDGTGDPKAIDAQVNIIRETFGLTSAHQQTGDDASKFMDFARKQLGGDNFDYIQKKFDDFKNSTVIPFYKNQGLPDDQIAQITSDPNKWLKTYVYGGRNPITAITQGESETLGNLDDTWKRNAAFLKKLDGMNSSEIKQMREKHWNDLSDVWKDWTVKAEGLKQVGEGITRKTGIEMPPIWKDLPGSILDFVEKAPPSQQLRNRLLQREEERKKGSPRVETPPADYQPSPQNQPPNSTSGTLQPGASLRDVMQNAQDGSDNTNPTYELPQ